MRARLLVAAIAGLTTFANLSLGVRVALAVSAGLAVIVVGEVVGRLVRPRPFPDALSIQVADPPPGAALISRAHPLSPRELEVAVLITQDLTSKEVAGRLGIKKGTVDTHFDHIKNKIPINSRAQLAIWLMERGLLPPPSTRR
jgi:DNA-binding CsgD family transcriptional regulator